MAIRVGSSSGLIWLLFEVVIFELVFKDSCVIIACNCVFILDSRKVTIGIGTNPFASATLRLLA
jgi:hypothetical protein